MIEYPFEAPVWVWSGKSAWYFVTLPVEMSKHIKALFSPQGAPRRGFGSVAVVARIGGTRWKTSIFPSREVQSYILPLKSHIRTQEQLTEGTTAHVILEIDA